MSHRSLRRQAQPFVAPFCLTFVIATQPEGYLRSTGSEFPEAHSQSFAIGLYLFAVLKTSRDFGGERLQGSIQNTGKIYQ